MRVNLIALLVQHEKRGFLLYCCYSSLRLNSCHSAARCTIRKPDSTSCFATVRLKVISQFFSRLNCISG